MPTLNLPGLDEDRKLVVPEDLAGGVAYFSIIPAVVFLLSEPYKRSRFVRFNAWQSIFLFIAWLVVWACASVVQSLLPNASLLTLSPVQVAGLVAFFVWMGVVWNAFDAKRTKLPLIGKLAKMQTTDAEACSRVLPRAYGRLVLAYRRVVSRIYGVPVFGYRRLPFLPSLLRPLKERAGAAVAFFFLALGRFFSALRPVSSNPSSTMEN